MIAVVPIGEQSLSQPCALRVRAWVVSGYTECCEVARSQGTPHGLRRPGPTRDQSGADKTLGPKKSGPKPEKVENAQRLLLGVPPAPAAPAARTAFINVAPGDDTPQSFEAATSHSVHELAGAARASMHAVESWCELSGDASPKAHELSH
jgi:hypothetical protein